MGMSKRNKAFGREIVKTLNATEAYDRVYPGSDRPVVKSNAARLLNLPNVREYILSLMQKNEHLCPESLTKRLGTLTNSQNEGISLEAVKTGLKSYGVFDQNVVDNSVNSINITFSDPAGDGLKHSSQAGQPDTTQKLDVHSANSEVNDKRG